MNYIAHARGTNVNVAPRKVRLVIDLIRGKNVKAALGYLENERRAANPLVLNILKSAVANAGAKSPNTEPDELFVVEARVDKGMVMKRFRPRAMGRGAPILKKMSNVIIKVGTKSK